MNVNKKSIPVFFACDENFIKFTSVTIRSLIENASREFCYEIHILCTAISDSKKQEVLKLSDENFKITFDDVAVYLNSISYRLPIRDYYSKTTYYRLFIPEMFPELDKALYLDSDMIVLGDISQLYNHDIGENYVGACNEQAMVQTDVYGTYVEKCIGLDRNKYFNAGMMLINCAQFRKQRILDQFIRLLHEYSFVVTQDEDYLNLICCGNVFWIENSWNVETYGEIKYTQETAKIIHYLMVGKPWHFRDVKFAEIFWEYAKRTPFYDEIKSVLENYTDQQRKNDYDSVDRLAKLAESEINRPDNFLNRKIYMEQKAGEKSSQPDSAPVPKSQERLEILRKISELEKQGKFWEDVEDDPPARQIQPGEVDYQQKKLSSRIKSFIAFRAARKFLKKMLKTKQIIISGIEGTENLGMLKGGTIITCNHFNPFDSFAIQYVYDEIRKKHRHGKFFRIIKEGNYTSYTGFYGELMRSCNTLPLSSNYKTMNEFIIAVKTLLAAGNYILIYPEQSLWWNYKKPKPLRAGAYKLAVKNNVAVLPVFITMKDSDILDSNGFFVQEYTIHICRPIFPDSTLSRNENVEYMMNENYSAWKKIYENTYKIPLSYK
ncbi:glycosyltransferase [Treponema sp.]|uniref:glycosyltransferase n=1 Tax=Treponema sp. TaxID=166 RepID=UPI003F124D44